METDQKKLLLAVTVLVLALSMLAFQVFRRIDRDARRASEVSDPGVMIEEAVAATADVGIAWAVPGDLNEALAVNPFLRPPGAVRRTGGGSPAGATFVVRGIRTGPVPTVIINDRIRRLGDELAGWRVVAIERDRVTLRSSHGRTIHLDAR